MMHWWVSKCTFFLFTLKGTVIVNSRDPPCKDDIARFTTVPLNTFSYQVWIRYQCFVSLNGVFSFADSFTHFNCF